MLWAFASGGVVGLFGFRSETRGLGLLAGESSKLLAPEGSPNTMSPLFCPLRTKGTTKLRPYTMSYCCTPNAVYGL